MYNTMTPMIHSMMCNSMIDDVYTGIIRVITTDSRWNHIYINIYSNTVRCVGACAKHVNKGTARITARSLANGKDGVRSLLSKPNICFYLDSSSSSMHACGHVYLSLTCSNSIEIIYILLLFLCPSLAQIGFIFDRIYHKELHKRVYRKEVIQP
jgi:hypothetical protein